jgi:hypothetical protein
MPATGAIVNLIWRFYTDDSQRWKWQQLSVGREVITESDAAYMEYEGCVADAKSKGYVFQPSQARLAPKAANTNRAANARRRKQPPA